MGAEPGLIPVVTLMPTGVAPFGITKSMMLIGRLG
jgi:hypothetical protein